MKCHGERNSPSFIHLVEVTEAVIVEPNTVISQLFFFFKSQLGNLFGLLLLFLYCTFWLVRKFTVLNSPDETALSYFILAHEVPQIHQLERSVISSAVYRVLEGTGFHRTSHAGSRRQISYFPSLIFMNLPQGPHLLSLS